ncbi:MAG: sulfatase-like hydrolase/transferase, partial [Verrucomicrobia bacterium]|nr:sulfatase-like hydrolase/transferase [Verrucomicrobiota bacterium]
FTISFTQLAAYLLILSFAATALLALLVCVSPRRIRTGLLLAVLALGCLAWLQSVLNTGNHGVLDGSTIEWDSPENRRAFYFDTSLWLVGLGLVLGLGGRVLKHAGKISAALLVAQAIGLAHLAAARLSAPGRPWWSQYSLDPANKFTFSDRRNVILLVADGFQSDVFQQLREERPGLFTGLDGFTYYPDTVGAFPFTQLSVPVMLTGTYYDNSVPFVDFIKTQFDGHAIPTILKREGFHAEVYPLVPITAYLTPDSADNLKKATFRIDWREDGENLNQLLDIAWFLAAPQPIKKRLYNNDRWFLQSLFARDKHGGDASRWNKDVAFVEQMENTASVRPGPPVFKFYHLVGVHYPWQLDENLEVQPLPKNRGGYKRQAIATMKIVNRFLEKLKALGVYDQSLIIVSADHGWGEIGVHDPAGGRPVSDEFFYSDLFIPGRALPLLLIKPLGGHGPLRTSEVQATLADIPKTICSELKLESPFEGISITDDPVPDAPRPRRWHNYMESWISGNEFVPPLQEYIITGRGWREESWKLSRRILNPGEVVVTRLDPLPFGLRITPEDKDAWKYLAWGWGKERHGLVPCTRPYARLGFPIPPTRHDVALILRWKPYFAPAAGDGQKVEIQVNDRHLRTVFLTNAALEECRLDIPNELLRNHHLEIAFRMPGAIDLAPGGTGPGHRTLGIALQSLVLLENKPKPVP